MLKTMTQDTKDRVRELEGQKVILEDRLVMILEYAGNYVKMVELEQEIFEIEDTIKKLTAQNIGFQPVDARLPYVIIKLQKH